MNAESFAEYLKTPSKLYQINYQELKSLALQYPYCQNLQWLLLQKSRMDGHRDANTNLEKTAAGSIDRALLYKKVKAIAAIQAQVGDLWLTDDVLELPTLSSFRQPEPILRDTPARNPMEEPKPIFQPLVNKSDKVSEEDLDMSKLQVPPRPTEFPNIEPEPAIIDPSRNPEIPTPADPEPSQPNPQPEVPDPIDPSPTLPDEPRQNEEIEKRAVPTIEWEVAPRSLPTAVERQASVNYAKTYQPPKLQFKLASKPSASEKKEADIVAIAAKSINEKEEVASETLALILARQGHREKAIRMYEQLILKIPEKSAYFAAQIQKLKQI